MVTVKLILERFLIANNTNTHNLGSAHACPYQLLHSQPMDPTYQPMAVRRLEEEFCTPGQQTGVHLATYLATYLYTGNNNTFMDAENISYCVLLL
jgi:hypothetical protein